MPIHPLGFLAMVLFLVVPVAIALGIALVVRAGTHVSPPAPPHGAPGEPPLEILARRFASGEITAEEYEKARDLLQPGGQAAT